MVVVLASAALRQRTLVITAVLLVVGLAAAFLA
jgi:hypothetical protein